MPLQETSGNVTTDAYGGGVAAIPNYIEDVFSTYLYTGNGSINTITNNIDLSTKGGLVWMKSRNNATYHGLYDTARGTGTGKSLYSNTAEAQGTNSIYQNLTAFNTTGFTLGSTSSTNAINGSGDSYVSWTFLKQPKFFDVVTYTGNGTARAIAHNLGSVPGCMIVKGTTQASAGNWNVYHTSVGNGSRLLLNDTTAAVSAATTWNNTDPTSTQFSVGTSSQINASGESYVAYLFAHNAGGFGLTGTDNVISCGSYTGNGSTTGPIISLDYEPQFVITKGSTYSGNWYMFDIMRGFTTVGSNDAELYPSSASSEYSGRQSLNLTSTGFQLNTTNNEMNRNGETYIYIAIRRGPMKVPTVGTSVFAPIARTANGAYTQINTTFAPDLVWTQARVNSGYSPSSIDKLRGPKKVLLQNDTSAELTSSTGYDVNNFNNTGVAVESQGQNSVINYGTESGINWFFQRAPSFFDEVCYTGTNSGGLTQTIPHNLGVAPELIIFKKRGAASNWTVVTPPVNSNSISLNLNAVSGTSYIQFVNTYGTSSITTASGYDTISENTTTYVAYLFATCAGVSKVGSYTGNGTTQTINCGFTGGARFVLIKRTDSTGNWYVYDTSRGMTVLTDPYLWLNSTDAEVATLGSVTTVSTGFALNSTILAAINTNAASYIFLAIA
jgi:hypothetical protein